MTNYTRDQVNDARDRLAFLKPGDAIAAKVLHVSRSGMQREIGLYVARISDDGAPYIDDISFAAAALLGVRRGDRGGVIMGGVGMDMGFAAVYGLSRRLFPDGHYCTGSTGYTPTGRKAKAPRCPSNDHSNDRGNSEQWLKGFRKSRHHGDGGYALTRTYL